MNHEVIGLECGLPNAEVCISEWLAALQIDKYKLFIQTLMLNDLSKDHIYAKEITLDELEEINKNYGIMEITLTIFPANESPCVIADYAQFSNSPSICSLIYYDAGWLELYIKPKDWLETIEQNLQKCRPDYIRYKTAANDGRVCF